MNGVPLSSVEILKAVNEGRQAELDLVPPKLWKKTWKGDQAAEAALMDPVQWKPRVGIPTRNQLPGRAGFPANYSTDSTSTAMTGISGGKKRVIPEYEEYTFQTSHYRDMYWTLNQVQVFLAETEKPGALKALFDTVTPNLGKIMVRTDGGEWKPVTGGMTWTLKPGRNILEAKPVNKWGMDGIVSEVTVNN